MERIHQLVINRRNAAISLTADNPGMFVPGIEKFLGSLPSLETPPSRIEFPIHPLPRPVGIEISAAVNFVAKTWSVADPGPGTQALLFLLARNLSTSYLWDKVRVEGGAYGGMSMFSVLHPVFACASYRDPNLTTTLAHFEQGLKEISTGIDQEKVDQSIIGAIGKIDAPRTPHAKGLSETIDLMSGYSPSYRQELRSALLGATSGSLKEVSEKLLSEKGSAVCVLGSKAAFDAAQGQGLALDREPLL